MTVENVQQTRRDSKRAAAPLAVDYDPFVRGPFPVGVRTIVKLDTSRNRMFSFEIWYPAAAQHAGQDRAPETQDVFMVPLRDKPRRQTAVRDAADRAGSYPLIIFSHYSGGHRRAGTLSPRWIILRWWQRNWRARRARLTSKGLRDGKR